MNEASAEKSRVEELLEAILEELREQSDTLAEIGETATWMRTQSERVRSEALRMAKLNRPYK